MTAAMRARPYPAWLSAAALALAAVAAALGLWHGLRWSPDLIDRLRDDAYYEFAWAANLAAGRGPVVSDGVTTSGVQYLWSLTLVPLVWLFGAAALPSVAPWLGLVLHCAAAASWWRAARGGLAGRVAALLWLGHPLLVRESQNGQETALACLLLSLLWHARRERGAKPAMLSVLVVLARSDLWPCVVLLYLLRASATWRALVVPGFALAIVLGLNRTLGGGWLQDSAAPMAWLWHSNFALGEPGFAATLRQVWWYLRPVLLGGPFALGAPAGSAALVYLLLRPAWHPQWRWWPLGLVGAAALAGVHDLTVACYAALAFACLPTAPGRTWPRALTALALGLLAVVALHWAVRWYPRDYYAAPLAVGAAAAWQRLGRRRWVLPVLAGLQLAHGRDLPSEPLGGQVASLIAGQHLAQVVPATTRVGSFNAGILAFTADVLAAGTEARRAFVNLDGVVDARSFAALQQAGLAAWLDAQGIEWLLDHPRQFASDPRQAHANGHWFGNGFVRERDLLEVVRYVAVGETLAGAEADCRLYWRRPRGAGAAAAPALTVPATLPAADLGLGPRGGRLLAWPAAPGQRLAVELAAGQRRPLYACDAATTVVLWLGPELVGTGRLFVDDAELPLLVLSPL